MSKLYLIPLIAVWVVAFAQEGLGLYVQHYAYSYLIANSVNASIALQASLKVPVTFNLESVRISANYWASYVQDSYLLINIPSDPSGYATINNTLRNTTSRSNTPSLFSMSLVAVVVVVLIEGASYLLKDMRREGYFKRGEGGRKE